MKIERFHPANLRAGQLRTLASVVSMTLVASVIAGCGGGGDSGSPASTAAGTGTSTSGTASGTSGTSISSSQLCTTALATAQGNASSTSTASSSGNTNGTPSPATVGTPDAPVDHLIVKLTSASSTSLANGARALAASSDAARVGDVISRVLTQWNAQRLQARVLASTAAAPALPSFDNVQLERTMSDGAAVVSLGKRVTPADAVTLAQAFAADSEVAYAEPDRRLFVSTVPTDPNYSQQWNDFDPTAGVNMPAAWNLSTGSSSVVTAVIDTGYRPHADISGNLLPGYDFISDVNTGNNGHGRSSDATDPGDWVTQAELNDSSGPFYHCASAPSNSTWHGTEVAGLIGASANNGIGIAGVSWFGKILPVRALGKCGGTTSDIADAMRWAAGIPVAGVPNNTTPAKIINLSLGGSGPCGSTFQSAINDVIARGVTVVVAAGNDGLANAQDRPANCTGVIAVGATDSTGKRAWYSNFSSEITLSAPGSSILSTSNTGTTTPGSDTYAYNSGTSLAAPQVAGVAALMLSLNPNLTPAQIAQKLAATARPSQITASNPSSCTAMAPGAGLMDAGAAVASATR
ncbi:peptidase [Burkholderia glumae]|uniref:S8 family peptidase n=1 Tax=Burkholderia glumae TaxID=337 RepID=UPI000F5ED532|nr:S8 family peptidase [Burkholderia glumae]MCQ0031191.1 S8 family peptidase [Burkholderia glumae]MCQ0036459.1 S8 family peptidase [Burkholderia glumae]RQZ72281.1 peptidase [Burkholderia glumae]UVS84217.1 peptidase [Burkholderia glumae]